MKEKILFFCFYLAIIVRNVFGGEGIEVLQWKEQNNFIVEPGKEATITIRFRASEAEKALLELRDLNGKILFDVSEPLNKIIDEHDISFKIPCEENLIGDHSLRFNLIDSTGKLIYSEEHPLMLAYPNDLILIFTKNVYSRGLKYDPTDIRPKKVQIDNTYSYLHEMGYNSRHGAEGWWRSLLITIADEKLRHSARPIADIDIVFRHEVDAPVELIADTQEGPKKVASGWGKKSGWQSIHTTITNARFSAPEIINNDPKERLTHKCDLRFNACNEGQIRSVRIHLPDASNPDKWNRFLDCYDLNSEKDWIIPIGEKDNVSIKLVNKATTVWKGNLRVEIADAMGKGIKNKEYSVEIPGAKHFELNIPIDSSTLSLGEHLLRLQLLRGKHIDKAWEHSFIVTDENMAFIIFEKEPIKKGMDFIRKDLSPVLIDTNGHIRNIWRAHYGSAELGWWRSIRMFFTDESWREGRSPIVDIEVYYRQKADAPVNISADTSKGGGIIASGWGGRGISYEKDPPIQCLKVQVDNAVFASREHTGKDEELLANKCDIRFNTCTADGEIRSIVVRRYERKNSPLWKRLLKVANLDLARDRYVFEPNSIIKGNLKILNLALIDWNAPVKIKLQHDFGVELKSKVIDVKVPCESESNVEFEFDLHDFKKGSYELEIEIPDIVKRTALFGISETFPLEKAYSTEEFLYGIGGVNILNNNDIEWMNFLGIDLIRNLGGTHLKEHIDNYISLLKKNGFKVGHLMIDPPWHNDPAIRMEKTNEIARWSENVAKKYGDFIKWYELGNEPDLTFFYRGPIQSYIDSYVIIYDAIKKASPASIVMNGGLCFHSKEGWERAHELVQKMPDNKIDIWAYHGHGAGALAERMAWERQDKTVRGANKKISKYVETESGFPANEGDRHAARIQARTIVQKNVFAQSVKMPFLLWYTFGNENYPWGIRFYEKEPRPALMAMRTMIQNLRHKKHVSQIDIGFTPEKGEAHHFISFDNKLNVIVFWAVNDIFTRILDLGKDAKDVVIVDLFGNSKIAESISDSLVKLNFKEDPNYLIWKSTSYNEVRIIPPALVLPEFLPVFPGANLVINLEVQNPFDQDKDLVISVKTSGNIPIKEEMYEEKLQLKAREKKGVKIRTEFNEFNLFSLPMVWTVFAPVNLKHDLLNLSDYKKIPERISINGIDIEGRKIKLDKDGKIKLDEIVGGFEEYKQALLFATIDCDQDKEIEVGAAADWWMEWYLNGNIVYSTIDRGNNGEINPLTHTFKLNLKKGENIIIVKVLSGSGGWSLVMAGPDELNKLKRRRIGFHEGIEFNLLSLPENTLISREIIPVKYIDKIQKFEHKKQISEYPFLATLSELNNFFIHEPDQNKWYKGKDDLSGHLWLLSDDKNLYIKVMVIDDKHNPGDKAEIEISFGENFQKKIKYDLNNYIKQDRDEKEKITSYDLKIPKKSIDGFFAVRVTIYDDDWGELKQTAQNSLSNNPLHWLLGYIK